MQPPEGPSLGALNCLPREYAANLKDYSRKVVPKGSLLPILLISPAKAKTLHFAVIRSNAAEPVCASVDRRYVGKGLHIIDNCGLAPQT